MTDPTNLAPTDSADVTLLTGRRVPRLLHDAVLHEVTDRLAALTRGVNYTTKQICGDGFWSQLTDGEQRLAGQVLKDLVLRGLVPLVLVPWRHEFPLRFRLA